MELGRYNFSSWEDLVKKTGVTPETLKLIQETFRRHLVSTEADASGWVEKPSTSTAAAAAASEGPPSIATESDNTSARANTTFGSWRSSRSIRTVRLIWSVKTR